MGSATPVGLIFSKIIGSGEGGTPRGVPPSGVGSQAQRPTVPSMKSSTACLAAESLYCSGGDFMK